MMASVGMGLGGFLGGILYDLRGTYTVAIRVAVLMGFAGAALAYMLVDPIKQKRGGGSKA
ncbi:MAG: hypothetical protein HY665_05495, partial [Chloroflexi bacterium]|nr:hypothetical protein [Chloroflexota bacterium]